MRRIQPGDGLPLEREMYPVLTGDGLPLQGEVPPVLTRDMARQKGSILRLLQRIQIRLFLERRQGPHRTVLLRFLRRIRSRKKPIGPLCRFSIKPSSAADLFRFAPFDPQADLTVDLGDEEAAEQFGAVEADGMTLYRIGTGAWVWETATEA